MPSAVRLQQAVLVAALLVPTLVFGAATWWNRGEVLREGSDAVHRTAAVMHEHVAKVLDTADLVLARVEDRIAGMDPETVAAPETSAFLHRMKLPFEQFVSVWVADADGHVIAGSQPWNPANNIADRDFFRAQRDNEDLGRYVSTAFRGRATGTQSFAISRRRSDPEGGFTGTIHVALNPAYFAQFFAEAAPPIPHSAALFRADGAVLVREPPPPIALPTVLGPDSPVMRRLAQHQHGALFSDVSSLDGEERIYAYRKVAGWPVYVGFGTDTDALLARWYRNVAAYGVVAAAAALTLLLVGWLALRQARAAEAAEAALGRESAARAVAEARHAAEARFRGVFESRAVGIAVFDIGSGKAILANDRLLWMTGRTRAEFDAGEWDWHRVTAPEHLPLDEQAMREVRQRGWCEAYEKDFLRPDGTRLPVRVSSAPLAGERGGVVVLVQGILEQREAEMRRDLLMREVDHRAKNALATARAALRLTRAPTLEAFVAEVDGRIGALAQALTLLSTTQWHGADLATLLGGELSAFLGSVERCNEPRTVLSGPPVFISAAAVQALAMAVHELATNATKYGALSAPGGVLTLTWELVGTPPQRLRLVWQERGGPPVQAPPKGSGFGTRVLHATLTRQLGGTIDQRWEPGGLVCEIDLPAARVLATRPSAEAA